MNATNKQPHFVRECIEQMRILSELADGVKFLCTKYTDRSVSDICTSVDFAKDVAELYVKIGPNLCLNWNRSHLAWTAQPFESTHTKGKHEFYYSSDFEL